MRILSFPLRIFFKLLYHQLAWTYDWVAAIVSVGLWKDWVYATLSYLTGPIVLEIGHGPGHLLIELRSRDIEVVGIDNSRQMTGLARLRLKQYNYPLILANAYAQSLPFANDSFNQIVSTFPSEYINNPSTLGEIYRVLKPGGEFLVLPFAWLTSSSFTYRLASTIFHITGQSPVNSPSYTDKFVIPFRDAGYNVSTEQIPIKGKSEVFLIHASKPNRAIIS